MTLKEYTPGTAFTGVIGRTFDVSQPSMGEHVMDHETEMRIAMARQ